MIFKCAQYSGMMLALLMSLAISSVAQPRVDILCYHTFLGKPSIYTDFSVTELRGQITSLRNQGAQFITLQQAFSGQFQGEHGVVLFIDDGNMSAMQAYESVLKPMGIKPVFAIYPNVISNASFAMTWGEVKQVVEDGCEIASHGYYHLYLTSDFGKKDPTGFDREIRVSKQVLEEKLGIPITAFVYPFGLVSPAAKSAIAKAGYKYAFSLEQAPLNLAHQDAYELPRYMVTRSYQPQVFLKRVNKPVIGKNEGLLLTPEHHFPIVK